MTNSNAAREPRQMLGKLLLINLGELELETSNMMTNKLKPMVDLKISYLRAGYLADVAYQNRQKNPTSILSFELPK